MSNNETLPKAVGLADREMLILWRALLAAKTVDKGLTSREAVEVTAAHSSSTKRAAVLRGITALAKDGRLRLAIEGDECVWKVA